MFEPGAARRHSLRRRGRQREQYVYLRNVPMMSAAPDHWASGRAPAQVLALIGVLMTLGCYKPNIADYGFRCGSNDECPDGFSCAVGLCHKVGVDAGPGACTPLTGVQGCTPDPSLPCDPVCQTGCCANQKCTALNSGKNPPTAALGCVPAPTNPARGFNAQCDVMGAGTPDRTDDCVPGLIGIFGNGPSYCLQLCRTDKDCSTGIHCEKRVIDSTGTFMASVCGLPNAHCDPTSATNSGCGPNRTCYLVTPDATAGDTTICEILSGSGLRNSSCQYSRDCLPNFTCADVGPGAGTCLPVCANAATTGQCPTATSCQDFGQTYDYCY